jgi:hypothetical protein
VATEPYHSERITLVLQFYATMPDDDVAADQRADEISEQLLTVLRERTPYSIYDDSFSVLDWTSERDDG